MSQDWGHIIELEAKRKFKNTVPFIEVGVKDRAHTTEYLNIRETEVSGKASYRKSSRISTAELGAIHEFGLGHVPKRSFLFEPLENQFSDAVSTVNEIEFDTIDEELEVLSAEALSICDGSFDTMGYGTWQPLDPWYMVYSGRTNPPLSNTGQLRNALYAKYMTEITNTTSSGSKGSPRKTRSDKGTKGTRPLYRNRPARTYIERMRRMGAL